MSKIDETKVEELILMIENADSSVASIKEIEALVNSIMDGLRISAPFFDPGLMIFRMRKCAKPENIKEITYPPEKFVTDFGRANDIGQSLFYGSIGKAIPFFELQARVGDRLALSVWRNKTRLQLNHIGFSEDVTKTLNSGRELHLVYDFAKTMSAFDKVNNRIYNYLANIFTKKIGEGEKHLYKLSIAIANKFLSGDRFDGLMYPTIAMFGNADNVVLKPSYVDAHLEFISVEYIEITNVDGLEHSFDVLDSATIIKNDRSIDWSGKTLGFPVTSGSSFSHGGQGWTGNDSTGAALKAIPTTPIAFGRSELKRKYDTDFTEEYKIANPVQIKSNEEIIISTVTLNLNFENKSRFLTFYLPVCENPIVPYKALIENCNIFLQWDKDMEMEVSNQLTNTSKGTNKDLSFSGDVYIYSESKFDERAEVNYTQQGLKVFLNLGLNSSNFI